MADDKQANGGSAPATHDEAVAKLGALIKDIRIAMLSDQPGKPQWLVSREDPASLESYRRHKTQAWRAAQPQRRDIPSRQLTFPAVEDVYVLDVAGNTVAVNDAKSGARWTMVVAQPRQQGK